MAKRMDLRELILKKYSLLNGQEQKVAEQVLLKSEDLLAWSIQDLAQASGVSDSTVFRFCSKLGFEGLQNFKIALALSLPGRQVDPGPPAAGDPSFVLLEKIKGQQGQALAASSQAWSTPLLEDLVQALEKAGCLWILAPGPEASLGQLAGELLGGLGLEVQVLAQEEAMARQAAGAQAGQLVWIFSSRDRRGFLPALVQDLGHQGARTLAFTPDPAWAYAQAAQDQVLCAGRGAGALEGGYKYALLALVDYVYYSLYLTRAQALAAKRDREEALIRRLMEDR